MTRLSRRQRCQLGSGTKSSGARAGVRASPASRGMMGIVGSADHGLASDNDLDEMERRRTGASAAIVGSASRQRLIVSGPGTGKSFTFQQALRASGGNGLALTFIRNLVVDLEKDLEGLADVFTFHGFCRHLMHQHNVAGLQTGDYYPPLMSVVVVDLDILEGRDVKPRDIEERLHNLDTADGLIGSALSTADYYGAVSHTDLVYRVLSHFEATGAPAYSLVVVDEYQDFSLLETTFIAVLAEASPTLVAGDDDQALYKKLKHASPDFIRRLASGGGYEVFELPYCSRCTHVVVAAVNDLLKAAIAGGFLEGRLDKHFACYLPDKGAESADHPKIVHAKCSTANQPYPGRYVAQQLARIPKEDIDKSRARGYPTALVIGPNPFLKMVFDVVSDRYPGARMKPSTPDEIDVLDGYRRIARDEESRLGWRIVMASFPFHGDREAIRAALEADGSLRAGLPADYQAKHLELARLIGILLDGGELSADEIVRVTEAADRNLEEVLKALGVEDPDAEEPDEGDLDQPDVLFTSLVGAKGLSAEHVFIVGMNNGHLPRDNDNVTDEEICALLVALSRTRQQCHVVSAGFLGAGPLGKSVFLDALQPHLAAVTVNKDYDFAA